MLNGGRYGKALLENRSLFFIGELILLTPCIGRRRKKRGCGKGGLNREGVLKEKKRSLYEKKKKEGKIDNDLFKHSREGSEKAQTKSRGKSAKDRTVTQTKKASEKGARWHKETYRRPVPQKR